MERPEFVPFFRHVIDHPDCKNTEGIVYGYIYWLTKLKNEKCTAGNETLAELAKTTPGTVQQSLNTLEKAGFIRRIYENDNPLQGRKEIVPLLVMGNRPISGDSQNLLVGTNQNKSIKEEHIIGEDKLRDFDVVYEDPDSDLPASNKKPGVPANKRKAYDELIAWSEKERGFKFVSRTKQYRAFQIANQNGITRQMLIDRWEEMSAEKFWQQNGFDWMNVVDSFNRKGA